MTVCVDTSRSWGRTGAASRALDVVDGTRGFEEVELDS
jgi:hypothetical protein